VNIIRPHNLVTYSKCPKRAQFSWSDEPSLSLDARIVINVAKTAHLYHLRKEQPAPWYHMSTWMDKCTRDIFADKAPRERYKESEHILTRICDWYRNVYKSKHCDPAMINLPITARLHQNRIYQDTIDIVSVGDNLKLFDFQEVNTGFYVSGVKIYEDLLSHIKAWGFWKASGIRPDSYVRIYLFPNTVKCATIRIMDNMMQNADRIINHLVDGIRHNVIYPARSEQCASCPYVQGCSF
jgi:hypothetical protein